MEIFKSDFIKWTMKYSKVVLYVVLTNVPKLLLIRAECVKWTRAAARLFDI